jgi:hypothetical protein
LVLLAPRAAHAGGPRYVAGASYFDPAAKGAPLTWAQGTVSYYTDQGDLSPALRNTDANSFVDDAFSHWTSIPTAALTATRAGQLAEDVSGTNVTVNGDGTLNLPTDIRSSATDKPIAVIYDQDGSVVSAFLGAGAGDFSMCFSNAVIGGADNFSSDAHISHALIIINGNCAAGSSQFDDVKYRLVREIGQVIGLDWSQLNLNVITRNPIPTSDDFTGFPLMHYLDMISCQPITACYASADQPKRDDVAAISRLYPVTSENQQDFTGKQIFGATTARIHGSLYFADAQGHAAQPMQGVNVIARWVDPATNQPSRARAYSTISGALFRGNAGNPITGDTDALGQRYDRFGSDDTTLEGFFDLAGLEIPSGSTIAQYQLTVEPIDTNWSYAAGPYQPWQVLPSGNLAAVTVTVSLGGDAEQDLVMHSSAILTPRWGSISTWDSPAPVSPNGEWMGMLGTYGKTDYFQINAQQYRTLSVVATALDESGAPSELKARPVIGIWGMSDPQGSAPPAATVPFDTGFFGTTRLTASLLATTSVRIGIADERGDGRPDFAYHARVLYADIATPTRVGMQLPTGVALTGLGFAPGLTATVGDANAPIMALSGTQMVINVSPPIKDGTAGITLTDPATGATSTMVDTLTFGAGPNDTLVLIQGGNPSVPAGGETPNPIVMQVAGPSGEPVPGATVVWSTTSGTLSACNGATGCTVYSDDNGLVSTRLTVTAAGTITVTATLAPASYNPPQKLKTTVVGTSSSLDITLTSQYRWVAQGTSAALPLTARVLSNGVGQSGQKVDYQILSGSGSLSFASATTDAHGYAANTLTLTNLAAEVHVSACVAPKDAPCQLFYVFAVASSDLHLQAISGDGQMVSVGQNFQPIILRVIDSGSPPDPVSAAPVTLQVVVMRPDYDARDSNGQYDGPVILSSTQTVINSDDNGLVSITPTAGAFTGAVEIEVTATAGTNASQQFEVESWWPAPVPPSLVNGGGLKDIGKTRPAPRQLRPSGP